MRSSFASPLHTSLPRTSLPGFLTTSLCLLLGFAAPALAQDGGDVTLDDLRRSTEELGRQYDEQALALEKTGAYIGSLDPWPKLDPEYVFLLWSEAVLGAEALTAQQVLERSETVKLAVARNAPALELFEDERDMVGAAVEAVIAAGRHTHPDSDVKLRMVVLLASTSFDFSRGGQSTGSEGAHFAQITARLELPARILRAGEVHHVPLVVADTIYTRMWPEAPGRAELSLAMQSAARKLFDKLPGVTRTAPEGPGAWGPWIGDAAQSYLRFEAWNASFRDSSRKLGPALGAIPGFREIRPWDERYRQDWVRALGAGGFASGLVGAPDLLGEMFFDKYQGGRRLNGGGVLTARTSVLEDDAVAVLDGRYVRVAGASLVDVSFPRFASASNLGSRTAEIQQLAIREFVAELGPGGGRAGQVRHEDADLVAKFLRTRERVPLSEELVDEVSNKIAMALAGAADIPASWKARWKQAPGGEPMVYLPHIGDARRAELVPGSVQRAVRRLIDELTLADPVGLMAFDRPWSYDRARLHTALPDDFAAWLEGPRPSGPGALFELYVDTASSAAWDLAESYGRKDLYKTVRGQLAEAFEGQHVLVCSYIPNDGDMDTYTQRYFWYRTRPEGWDELVASLPPEIRMDRIGPPQTQAPRYVNAADELLKR